VSPFTEAVLKATSLTDGQLTAKTAAGLQRLYNHHGATEVYARIATRKETPGTDGPSGWAFGLQRAQLAQALGMPFNPELGLFATYGDGATYQEPPDFTDYPSIRLPGPWLSLTVDEMLPAMRQYGALVAQQILATKVEVNCWDLGNEVENGISGVAVRPLFPDTSYQPPDAVDPAIGQMSVPELVAMPEADRISWCEAHLWPHVARLLAAAADGIRSVDRGARFSTHISDFGQRSPAVQLAFWKTMRDTGYLPDLLGTSYYPTDGRTALGPTDKYQWLKDTAAALQQAHGRRIFIAEYAYPSAVMPPPYPFNDALPGYPQTPAGQHDFTRDLVTWGVTSGRLAGVRPWAPDYCTNSGWQPMSFFTTPKNGTATAMPGLGAIAEALAAAGCPSPAKPAAPALELAFYGRRHRAGGVLLGLRSRHGTLHGVTIQLLHGARLVASTRLAQVGPARRTATLRPSHGKLADGHYRLVARVADRVLIDRRVRLG
jgi:hypothetical protein